jgi:hypothetical protein
VKKRAIFLVDDELKRRMEDAAKSKGLSIAGFVRMAVIAQLAKDKR